MELVLAVLPFLAFLACPLMMALCFFSMRKTGCAAPSTETQAASQLPEERVAALQQQLHAIQTELTALQPAPAPPPALAPVSGNDRLVDVVPGAAHAARRPA
ncbi:MAG: hypothetical protein ACRDJC_24170 [Thermomicrobiales bacterium]